MPRVPVGQAPLLQLGLAAVAGLLLVRGFEPSARLGGIGMLVVVGGIAVVAIADTNRLAVDHALGIGGVVAGIAAVPASILACLQALLAPGLSRRWATPLMHIVSLLITLVMAGVWIALHLA